MKIVFRVDASTDIGAGHVARCLALAERLAEHGADIAFFCRVLPGNQAALIESKGHAVHRLSVVDGPGAEERDAEACMGLFARMETVDWVVVDHYGLAASWETALRRYARHVLVIDDRANRRHACDLLLDQNLYEEPQNRYRSLVDENTHCLLGPKYALLRREFRLRPVWPRAGAVRRLFVFFGGADPTDETTKALRAVQLLVRHDIAVDVVVGAMNSRAREIEELSRTIPQCQVLRNADMAALMREADLAIGAGGTTAWERCAQGLPAIAWPIAENQEVVITGLAQRGALYRPEIGSIADAEGLAKHLYALINNPALISLMSNRALTICDGLGVDRVLAEMRADAMSVQAAGADDVHKVYEWRNHPHVRLMSVDSSPIEWDAHQRWFRDTLARNDRRLLIGYDGDRAVGVIRFDTVEAGVAEVSIYTDPELVNRGYGAKLLRAGERWLAAHCPHVRRLVAKVRAENIASQRLFERGGYAAAHCFYQKEQP